MRKCENGCCSFGDNWKDEDIYCAGRAPEDLREDIEKARKEKQLNRYPEARK